MHLGVSAIDPPRARIAPRFHRRRHRRITAPAGLLLFLCMFLPAVKGCSQPVYPIAMPMFWPPYVYGVAIALAAAASTTPGVRSAVRALRVLGWVTVVGGAWFAAAAGVPGVVELVLGAFLVRLVGKRAGERRLALTAIVVGGCSLAWFGLWALSPDALVGVYLATLASAGMLAGGLVWLVELI